ncbi:unnamed protein product [Albugo candida]|uniref:Uncharacterized protein n=1 Tax=Albugo candida TaxID=65357 RepID=A0A024GVZ3_9STRA|nr:unnamed protein product [Albugo candida]|eukprot:CCI50743.1 unnamed protein product [Albugo candida]
MRPIFEESIMEANLHIGFEVNDILKALKSATSARILMLGSYQHVAQAFEKFGHEKVGTVVKEIFLARWDNDDGADRLKQSTSPKLTYNEDVASILQNKSLNGKFCIMDLRTGSTHASIIPSKMWTRLFLQSKKSIIPVVERLSRSIYPIPVDPSNTNDPVSVDGVPAEKRSFSVIVAALAMFYPEVFISEVTSEYEYSCNGRGGTKFTKATVITKILHEELLKLVLDLSKKYK